MLAHNSLSGKKIACARKSIDALSDADLVSLDKGELMAREKAMMPKEKRTGSSLKEPDKPSPSKKGEPGRDSSIGISRASVSDDIKDEKGGQHNRHHNKKDERQHDNEKKSSYIFAVSIIVMVILFAAIIAVPKLFKDPGNGEIEDHYLYNYFNFTKRYGTWFTETQEGNNLYQIALRYGPKELEDVIVEGNIASFRQIGEAYLTFDPTEEEFSYVTMANAEVSTKLAMHFGVRMVAACTKDAEVCSSAGAAIASCDLNRTLEPGTGIIFLSQEPGAKIIIDGNCAIIQGEGEDIIRAADRFMLGYYGIMK